MAYNANTKAKGKRKASGVSDTDGIEEKLLQMEEKIVSTMTKKFKDLYGYVRNISSGTDEMLFTYKICSSLPTPSNGVFVSICCGQIMGCKTCVESWYQKEIRCILCNNDEIGIKAMLFHAGNEIIEMLSQSN